jgi:benzoyl-CoA reductase subunit C
MGNESKDKDNSNAYSIVAELTNVPLRDDSQYIQEWKKAGGNIIGLTCTSIPEEILYAGNGPGKILPFRMNAVGCDSTEDADIHMSKMTCGYVKCLLQMGLDGQYDFLDGMVISSCCEPMRCTYEHWRDEVDPGFLQMLTIPHNTEVPSNHKWFLDGLMDLSNRIDEHFNRKVSHEDLMKAIKTYNTYRKLMQELYALRALDQPKLTGAEAAKIALGGSIMPKDLFNEKLAASLAELRKRPGISDYSARIMIAGGHMDDTLLIDIIEEAGAIVVTDNLSIGRKNIEGLVDEQTDKPFEALSQRYFNRVPHPSMVGGFHERVDFTKQLIQEARVDGVILQRLPFCSYHAVENLMESEVLEKAGIPTFNLERDYIASDKGRLKTRVQAFLEKIAG